LGLPVTASLWSAIQVGHNNIYLSAMVLLQVSFTYAATEDSAGGGDLAEQLSPLIFFLKKKESFKSKFAFLEN